MSASGLSAAIRQRAQILIPGGVSNGMAFLAPSAFLSALLLVRPLLDFSSEDQVSVAGLSLNAASAVGILVIIVLLGAVTHRRSLVRPAGTTGFVAVIVCSGLAAILAIVELSPEIGQKPLQELVRIAAIFAVFLFAANYLRDATMVRRLFVVVALSAVIPALVGIFQAATGSVPVAVDLTIRRINSTFDGPIPCGDYMAIAALILIAIPRNELRLSIRIAALVPILAALVLTYSRTSWAIFLLGVLILEFRRRKALVAAMIATAVAITFAVPSVHDRVLPSTGNSDPYSSYQWRIDNWKYYWQKYEDRPITGFGLRSSAVASPTGYTQKYGRTQTTFLYDAHNSVLKFLFEGGIFLLAAWVTLMFLIMRKLYRLARGRWSLAWHAYLLFVLWALLIFEGLVAEDPFVATAEMYAMFALTGALFGTYLSRDRDALIASTHWPKVSTPRFLQRKRNRDE